MNNTAGNIPECGDQRFLKILDEIEGGTATRLTSETLASDGRLLLEVVHTLNALQKQGAAPELDPPRSAPLTLPPEAFSAPGDGHCSATAPELDAPAAMSPEENAIRLAKLLAAEPPEVTPPKQ